MNPADVNLYLVGFMGTGKTTVARAVGQKLGFQVLDSDHEIERLRGKTIPDIFAQDGEAAFRVLEREFIERGHPPERTIIACGGGLVVLCARNAHSSMVSVTGGAAGRPETVPPPTLASGGAGSAVILDAVPRLFA